ncbi:sensor domain-containing diguanylate cyclase [Cohnella panacarvi]|uniref:sensor domain-containing diguanylate cyclase n=1 Tax=Cohnella panacarvi TaxID=400776 RepID=UPI00047D6E7A|nr:sensor domain-containing diguanylate cyclase [Cohnella panacarvi]
MRKNKGFTLRFAVNALVLFSVLVTVIISAVVGYQSQKDSLTRTTYQMNRIYTDKIADTVNGLFDSLFDSLDEFGREMSKDLRRSDLHERFELFQRTHRNFNAVFLIGKDGILVEGSNAKEENIGTKIDSVGANQALEERKPLVSEPYMSMTTNKLIVMVSHPVYDEKGEYAGFIGGSIRLHETSIFQKILGNAPFHEDGSYAYVAGSSGVLLYHPDKTRIGEDITYSEIVQETMKGRSGTQKTTNSRGIKMLASYTYISSAGWGIVSQTPNIIVVDSARGLVKELMLYMLPALILFIGVIYWLIGKLASPFSVLARFAVQLSSRNSGKVAFPSIHHWNYEANELHKAFGRAVRHFRFQFEHLKRDAQTDPLTGLFNRRTLDQFVAHHISQRLPFSMLIMDLDNFKSVNDTYGHDVGDEVLRFLAEALKRLFGEEYVVCRMGGEEFVVLVPTDDAEAALNDAESVRSYMADTASPTGNRVTISIGVATYPAMAETSEQLYRKADDALYRAKRLGRNRVELAGEDDRDVKSS